MSIKATRKSINETFRSIYQVPYCSVQYLMSDVSPMAYTCGVYGWNADVFAFGSVALVTGYRPFGKEVDKEFVDSFENRARQLCQTRKYSELAELREEFIKAL